MIIIIMVTCMYPDQQLYVVLINSLIMMILYICMFDLKSWSEKLNINISNAEDSW